MQVKKRNGTLQELDISQVRKQTIPACEGLNNVSYEELELNAKIMFFDGINSEDIQKALIKSARNLVSIEQSDYTYVAARLALYDLYHNIKRVYNIDKENKSGNVYDKVTLKDYINFNKEVFSGWYTKYTEEEIDELNKVINSKADLLYNYPGFIALEGRYLIKRDIAGKKEITELPQHMHMGIAMFCMQNEDKSKRIQLIKDYYIALSNLEFINATPINSNGRLKNGGLVSCLLGVAGDSAEGIMDMATEVAIGSKGGSGWGVDFSHIRSLGSSIGGQKNRSGGKVPFAKIYNDVLLAYNQGGRYCHIA